MVVDIQCSSLNVDLIIEVLTQNCLISKTFNIRFTLLKNLGQIIIIAYLAPIVGDIVLLHGNMTFLKKKITSNKTSHKLSHTAMASQASKYEIL